MLTQLSLLDTDNCISLPVSADGPLPPVLPDGLMIGKSSPARARVSRSRSLAKVRELLMQGTYGPTFSESSVPEGPLASWENRLRQRLARIGSSECELTWKASDMPGGGLLSRLVPSTPRIVEIDSGLLMDTAYWATATATARDWRSESASPEFQAERMAHPRVQDAAHTSAVDGRSLEFAQGVGRGEGWAESGLRGGRPAVASSGIPCGDVADTDTSERRADMATGNDTLRDQAGRHESPGDFEQRGDGALADAPGRQYQPSGTQPDQRSVARGDAKRDAWTGAKWLIGHDGKARRVEPSIRLLVNGIPHRAPLIRGYGNAIVPQIAAEMMAAWLEEFP